MPTLLTVARTIVLACILFAPAPLPEARAAEFDLDSGRAVLRRLQYCTDCGSALLVTDVGAGELVRCPDCGQEQPRLENQFLLTQLYQICKLCSAPLDPEGHAPGDVVECSLCLTRQPLVADAFARGKNADGLGHKPGFPPGTGKKTLLLSPNRPDAAITAIPLEEGDEESGKTVEETAELAAAKEMLELPDGSLIAKVPPPPPGMLKEKPAAPPLPEIAPAKAAAHNLQTAQTPPTTPAAPSAQSNAVEVPAVTADLFGGAATRPAATGGSNSHISSGEIIARVDGHPIYARDVDLVVLPVLDRLKRQANGAAEAELAQREQDLRKEVLGRLIDRELAIREAATLGHHPDTARVRARETELSQILAGSGINLRREAERDVIMADMRARFAEKMSPVTPTAVREFYQQHKTELQQPRRLALDQLVVYEDRASRAEPRAAREIAFEIANSLEQGVPFEELRQRYDEFLPAAALPHAAPALKPEDVYSRQLLAAGGDLRTGAVFGPVPMSGMYLFGKVIDHRPAGAIPFAEAENAIRVRLEAQAADQAFAAWLSGLRARANIEESKP